MIFFVEIKYYMNLKEGHKKKKRTRKYIKLYVTSCE